MDMERARRGGGALPRRVTGLPVMVQPNAGQPKLVNMKVVYDETPEQMVRGVAPLLAGGREHRGRLLRQHAGAHSRVSQQRWTNI